MEEIFKLFGIFSIGATLIVSVLGFISKKIINQILNKDIEKFKNKLHNENEKSRLIFEKEIEGYKAELNLIYSKQIQLYSKKSEIIESLYKRLVELNFTMIDMTALFKNITGKDEKNVQEEELDRVDSVAKLANDFFKFYSLNKIYFEKETCALIENLQENFRKTHSDYSFRYTFGLPPSEMTHRMAKEASERVREDIPKIMERLEDDFRISLGVIEKQLENAP